MENYEKISDIGKGSFGVVSKIKRKQDGRILVWKELNYGKMSEKEKQQLVSEVNILRDLRSPNIVRYYDRIIDKEKTKIYIIMEYCEKGDMAQLIRKLKKDKEYLPEEFIWKILAQIVIALYECHNRKEGKILHRDLKPGNVFLDSSNNVKLGDFGLSRIMSDQSVFAYTHVGTPYYMSPEQISEQRYNEKCDIWSAGCVIYEISALRAPFEATNQIQLAMKIKAGKIDRIPSQFTDELFKVIQWMMHLDKDKRASVEELMVHPQICYRLRERKLKEMQMNIKKKEEDVLKKEKLVKEKEQELEKQQKEIEEKEKLLEEYENKLKQRQAALKNGNVSESDSVQASPSILSKEESIKNIPILNKRPPPPISQSRDFAQGTKEFRGPLENYKNKDVYMSNDNFVFNKKNNDNFREEEKGYMKEQQYQTNKTSYEQQPPLSHRRNSCNKENNESTSNKPPMLKQQNSDRNTFKPEIVSKFDEGVNQNAINTQQEIELQRKKLSYLRNNYLSNANQQNQKAYHSRQSSTNTSRERTQIQNSTQYSYQSNRASTQVNSEAGSFLRPIRRDASEDRARQEDYQQQRKNSGFNSSKNLRCALEEITQKIQNKYLS